MSADEKEKEELDKINKKKMQELMQRAVVPEPRGKPILLTDSNFSSEISKHDLLVVDFWAPWCGPCRMIAPVIEHLAVEYASRVVFGKLNVDENPRVSNLFGIRSIPALIVFHKGKAVDSVVGAVPKAYIESKFKPYLVGSGPDSVYG